MENMRKDDYFNYLGSPLLSKGNLIGDYCKDAGRYKYNLVIGDFMSLHTHDSSLDCRDCVITF